MYEWRQQTKLSAADGTADSYFGGSVSISGDSVVIGADGDAHAGTYTGSAYVFARSGNHWFQQSKLTASDASAGDRFGTSVSISGNTVIVGAYLEDQGGSNSGAAYIFERDSTIWTQQSKLKANDATTSDFFGASVGISGESVVVGAKGDDQGGLDSGAAYIFVRNSNTWIQQTKLKAGDAAISDYFGESVAISGDSVIVGATGEDQGGSRAGAAYVFVRNGTNWTQQSKLKASDAAVNATFGFSVAISGNSVIVGALLDNEGATFSGAAYIFQRNATTWTQQAKLKAADRATEERYGTSVAISGTTAIVGASRHSHRVSNSGSAYLYGLSGGTWSPRVELSADDAHTFSDFGFSIAIAGDTVVVGSRRDDLAGNWAGRAYVFVRSGDVWIAQDKLIGDDTASDDYFGDSVAISGDSVVVSARGSIYTYVFVRNGNNWVQQGKLAPSDPGSYADAVAISGDVVVIGAPSEGGPSSGAVYVFRRHGNNWTQHQKLKKSNPTAGDGFGTSVAISGDFIIAGCPRDSYQTVDSGSAYIFVRYGNDWQQQQPKEIKASDAAAGDFFGRSVAISGDSVIVGAIGNNQGGTYSGAAYVFVRSGSNWTQQKKLRASDAAANDHFGSSVAISGNSVVVGAPKSYGGTQRGAAYVFTRSGTSWTQQNKLASTDTPSNTYDEYGRAVAISGDRVIVGSDGRSDVGPNRPGSVFIYSIAHYGVRGLLFYSHLGVELANAGHAPAFPGQALGTSRAFTFRIGNAGVVDVDLYSVTLGGVDQAQFGLTVPDISSTADIAKNESLDFTVSFAPAGSTSGLRKGVIFISSNDPMHPAFSINISGLGLSEMADTDGDGMTDWAEYSLGAFGFDWQAAQPGFVSDYYAQAPTAGLYSPSQMGIVSGSTSLINVDPVAGVADLIIGLQQSQDLNTFTPIVLDPARLSVDANGNIRYQLDVPPDKGFFRAEWKDQ